VFAPHRYRGRPGQPYLAVRLTAMYSA